MLVRLPKFRMVGYDLEENGWIIRDYRAMGLAPTSGLLNISKINGHYLFQYSSSRADPLMRQIRHQVPLGVREGILQIFEHILGAESLAKARSRAGGGALAAGVAPSDGNARYSCLLDLSAQIARLLIPREVLREIVESRADSLIISTNDPAIPWELARADGDFLMKRIPIGKIIPINERVASRFLKEEKSIIRVLLLANPTGDLCGADEEYVHLKHMFDRSPRFTVDYLLRDEVTLPNIMRLADKNSYDIVHYSGHSMFDVDTGVDSIFLGSGPVSSAYFVNVIGAESGPIFFFNSCSSSAMGGPGFASGEINGIVGSFLSAGAIAFIGASWPVVDESAMRIACEFYSQIGRGNTIGAALNNARLSSSDDENDLTWLGYSLIGNPELRVVGDHPRAAAPPVSDGHMAARLAWSDRRAAVIGGFHPLCAAFDRKQLVPLLISSECTGSQKLLLRHGAPYQSLDDLQGKAVAFPPLTGMEFFFWHMIDERGLRPDHFEVVHLQQSEIVSALRSGRIEAAIIWEPYLDILVGEGHRVIEPESAATDYTICPVCIDGDLMDDGDTVRELIDRYYRCVFYMEQYALKLPNLLSLYLHMSPEAASRALAKFRFFGPDDMEDGALRHALADYMRAEQRFMAERAAVSSSAASFADRIMSGHVGGCPVPISDGKPMAVAMQNSVSNTPFIVGRFLGLFC